MMVTMMVTMMVMVMVMEMEMTARAEAPMHQQLRLELHGQKPTPPSRRVPWCFHGWCTRMHFAVCLYVAFPLVGMPQPHSFHAHPRGASLLWWCTDLTWWLWNRSQVALCSHNTSVGYVQGFNFIASLLLMWMCEERAFWMMVHVRAWCRCILTRLLGASFFCFGQTPLSSRNALMVLGDWIALRGYLDASSQIIEDVFPPGYFSGGMVSAMADQRVIHELTQQV